MRRKIELSDSELLLVISALRDLKEDEERNIVDRIGANRIIGRLRDQMRVRE